MRRNRSNEMKSALCAVLARTGTVLAIFFLCELATAQTIPSVNITPSTEDMTSHRKSSLLLDELNDGITSGSNGFWAEEREGTIHFDFLPPHSLDALVLYNDINIDPGNGPEGIRNFRLEFFDDVGASLASPVLGLGPVNSPASGIFSFPEVDGVSRVDLVILDVNNPTRVFGAEIREVQFTGRPSCLDCGSSILKICKVAGEGVDVGTMFAFDVKGNSVDVPAGPAPGGYCKVAGTNFEEGSTITVEEAGPARYEVSHIGVVPPERLLEVSLPRRLVAIAIGAGVTEATFTNVNTAGYLEICKTGQAKGDFTFTVEGVRGEFVVPAGACSPAIEVKAGEISITERIEEGTAMVGCQTIPADRQVSCDLTTRTAVVKVPAGGISAQTIVFIVNWPRDDTL